MAPSLSQIRQIFHPFSLQGSQAKFFEHVADDVEWTITGHSPLSGTYNSKQNFIHDTIKFLGDFVVSEPLCLIVTNVVSDGPDGRGAVVEMRAAEGSVCRNGLVYDMRYCWVLTFDQKDEKIVKVTAYLDTKLLTDAIVQNAPQGPNPSSSL